VLRSTRCVLVILPLALLPVSAKDQLDEPPDVVERIGAAVQTLDLTTPVSFSPDGKLLAWGGPDGTIHIHDVRRRTEVRAIAAHRGAVLALQYSQDGAWIASGGADGRALVWDASSGGLVTTLNPGGEAVTSVRLSPDRSVLQTWSGRCMLWEVATGKGLPADAPGPDETVVVLEPRGEGGGCMHGWDPVTGRPYWGQWDGRNWTNAWTTSPDGVHLARADAAGRILVWEAASGGRITDLVGLPIDLVDLAFAPGGRTLAAVDRTGVVHAVDLRSGSVLWHSDPEKATCVTFSADGQRLAAGRLDGTVVVWRAGLLVPHHVAVVEAPTLALQEAWADIRADDAAHAWQGVWALAGAGDDAVRFLRGKLPVPKADEDEVRRLIADLDADEYEVRERAQRGLEGIRSQARPLLEKTLAGTPSPELRTRIELLLSDVHAPPLAREDLAGHRAVMVLERVRTPSARAFLAELSGGPAEARLTLDAKAAAVRLAVRSSR